MCHSNHTKQAAVGAVILIDVNSKGSTHNIFGDNAVPLYCFANTTCLHGLIGFAGRNTDSSRAGCPPTLFFTEANTWDGFVPDGAQLRNTGHGSTKGGTY